MTPKRPDIVNQIEILLKENMEFFFFNPNLSRKRIDIPSPIESLTFNDISYSTFACLLI